MEEADDHDDDDHDEDADDDGCVQTHYGCILRHKHPEADPKQKCDGNHREANADHMCKHVLLGSFSSDACRQIPTKLWQGCVKLPTTATD